MKETSEMQEIESTWQKFFFLFVFKAHKTDTALERRIKEKEV